MAKKYTCWENHPALFREDEQGHVQQWYDGGWQPSSQEAFETLLRKRWNGDIWELPCADVPAKMAHFTDSK